MLPETAEDLEVINCCIQWMEYRCTGIFFQNLRKYEKNWNYKVTQCSITVVTQYDEVAEDVRKRGISVFYNLHPDEGISSSLRIGLRGSWDTDACLFTVSDQPWLRCETILELIEKFRKEKKGIACVQHNGKTGNPCIFSGKYFDELMELEGDVGGKRVIRKHREDTVVLDVSDERELLDVDSREVL